MSLFLISLYLDRFPDTLLHLYRRFLRLIELTKPSDSQDRFLRLGSAFLMDAFSDTHKCEELFTPFCPRFIHIIRQQRRLAINDNALSSA